MAGLRTDTELMHICGIVLVADYLLQQRSILLNRLELCVEMATIITCVTVTIPTCNIIKSSDLI